MCSRVCQRGPALWACSQSYRGRATSELALQEQARTAVSTPVHLSVEERLLRPPVCDNGAERQLLCLSHELKQAGR